ncbi:hypothetical protein SynBIOSU31_01244 [Synechococcus sp. BIOS-U3-1]|nr:hypothetical protein SynBIOSU31_01244 [Synechococcus sp. BIOS-U3-1]
MSGLAAIEPNSDGCKTSEFHNELVGLAKPYKLAASAK